MSRPAIFSGMGAEFTTAFGDGEVAEITIAAGEVVPVGCIFREFRAGGYAESEGVAVEGVSHTLAIAACDDPGVEQDMPVRIVSTGQSFMVAGVSRDGRAMTRILLSIEA